jgi:hypothetical protein
MTLGKYLPDTNGEKSSFDGKMVFVGDGTLDMWIGCDLEAERAVIAAKREAAQYRIEVKRGRFIKIGTPVLPNSKGAYRK